jgi:hypothetical protein
MNSSGTNCPGERMVCADDQAYAPRAAYLRDGVGKVGSVW